MDDKNKTTTVLGVPLRPPPDALMKHLNPIPPASPAVMEDWVQQLKSVAEEIQAAREIAKAGGQLVAVTKTGAYDDAAAELPTAEETAREKLAEAKAYGRRIAEKLRANQTSEPERSKLLAEFDRLCMEGRAAALQVVRRCYQLIATTSSGPEAQALAAKANAWLDEAANVRDVVAPL